MFLVRKDFMKSKSCVRMETIALKIIQGKVYFAGKAPEQQLIEINFELMHSLFSKEFEKISGSERMETCFLVNELFMSHRN